MGALIWAGNLTEALRKLVALPLPTDFAMCPSLPPANVTTKQTGKHTALQVFSETKPHLFGILLQKLHILTPC